MILRSWVQFCSKQGFLFTNKHNLNSIQFHHGLLCWTSPNELTITRMRSHEINRKANEMQSAICQIENNA